MDIIDRIVTIANEKGISQKEICTALNISSGTFSTWKIRKTDPPAKYLSCICKLLDISTDYLLTGKETTQPEENGNTERLTERESRLLDNFRCLTEYDKGRIIERMEMMIESYPPDVKENVS